MDALSDNGQRGRLSSRRWFQFGTRSLFVLMAVSALMALAWKVYVFDPYHAEQRSLAALKKLNPKLQFSTFGPGWLRKLAGERYFSHVSQIILDDRLAGRPVTDDDLADLKGLSRIYSVRLQCKSVSPRGLENLNSLPRLRQLIFHNPLFDDDDLKALRPVLTRIHSLDIGNTRVTDNGLQHLSTATQLRSLGVGRTQITDDGMRHLRKLTKLEYLDLLGDNVTDLGLWEASNLKSLRVLNIDGTVATYREVLRIQRHLPNCEIWGHPPIQ